MNIQYPELTHLRDFNKKSYDKGNGEVLNVFDVGWAHYLKPDGTWDDIDTTITETVAGFVMSKAPFSVVFPKFANQKAVFTVNNRFDVHTKSVINDPSMDM